MLEGTDLELLRVLRGPLYTRRRDQMLASAKGFAEIADQLKSQPDRRLELTARFLAGWEQDREIYEGLDRALAAVDYPSFAQNVTGIGPAVARVVYAARQKDGERLLPYCYEQLVKLGEGLPDYKRMALFRLIGDMPTEASIEPLLWTVDETMDTDILDGAHQTLLNLPFQGWKDRLTRGKANHQGRAFIYEDLLQRIRLAKKKP